MTNPTSAPPDDVAQLGAAQNATASPGTVVACLPPRMHVTRGMVVRIAFVCMVVSYAALLRFDAITQSYGPAAHPGWLRRLQQARVHDSVLRPAAIRWDPAPTYPHRDGPPSRYRSDPYTYLQYAREMQSFFAAQRREPVFPFTTRVFLGLLDQQDAAISFASAAFSVLAVVATYLLGARAFSFGVGLAAAFLLGIEYDVVTWAIEGWRDDAFTFVVVASVWAMLRHARTPSRSNAIVLGLLAGLACLVRITAVSFLVPGFVYLLLRGSGTTLRQRIIAVGLASITASVVVAPYVVNCWRVYGDPLYAINVHADVYRAAEGQDIHASQTARDYLATEASAHPIRTLDTFVLGMTQYPFTNKWVGFDRWLRFSGRWLAIAALLGLLLFTGSPAGRFLLGMSAASLVPFAFTWRLLADWRFTEHVYPFLLIAASLTLITVARALMPASIRTLTERRPSPRTVIRCVSVLTIVVVGWLSVTRVLPVLIVEEALAAHGPATIMAGDRDAVFFADGWPGVVSGGNVTTRITDEPRAAIRVPLPAATDYDAMLRLDSAPLDILINGTLIARCDPGSTPERIGVCRFRVPATAARKGFNRVMLVADRPGLRVWYLRLSEKSS